MNVLYIFFIYSNEIHLTAFMQTIFKIIKRDNYYEIIYGDGVKSDETTIISSGVKIEGTVTTNGNIRVDGEIKGDIISDNSISIGDSGIVNGKINAAVVTIGGTLTGSVAAKEKLTLTSRGKINGDVVVKSFVIEDGGLFNGNCRMGVSVGSTLNTLDSKQGAIKN